TTIKHQHHTLMIKLHPFLIVAGAAAALMLGTPSASAQRQGGRGNFDPEQMRQRMMERYREAFDVKSDDEWKVIETRITKVMDAQRDLRSGGGFGRAFGRRGGDNGGGPGGAGGAGGGGDNPRPPRNPFGGEPSAEAESLQKAIDAKASNEEIKSKLA